ncbi:MAG: saccharopine dehydrogenase family protein, partial [Candidatus Hodarchaeota archaeon]
MNPSVLVLGGCGAVGSVVVKELLQMTDASIVIGDHDFAKAKEYASSLKNERVTAQFTQGENENELIPLLKNFDLLADCTNIRHHYNILEAAIEAKVNYYCLTGSLYSDKLKLDAKAKKAGITAILAIGSSPGLTNLLAKRAAYELDEVEEIQITFLPYRAISFSPGLLDTFLHQFFEEEKARCYYKNGELIPVPPFSGERTIYLPEPYGPRKVYYMAHAETTMLAKTIKGVKLIETRGAWPQEIMEAVKTFYEYNFFSKNQIQI